MIIIGASCINLSGKFGYNAVISFTIKQHKVVRQSPPKPLYIVELTLEYRGVNMANNGSTTLPVPGRIQSQRDKPRKKGVAGKLIGLGVGASAFIILVGEGYKALNSKDVTPDRYPTDGVEETKGMPNGFGQKPVVSGKIEREYLGPIERHARVDENGTIYPDGVDRDYDKSDIKDSTLRFVEYFNAKDFKRLKEMTALNRDFSDDLKDITIEGFEITRIDEKDIPQKERERIKQSYGKEFDKVAKVDISPYREEDIDDGTRTGKTYARIGFLYSSSEKTWYLYSIL